MILPVLTFPNESLTTVCSEYRFQAPEEVIRELEANLIETMLAYNGIGLAANQVGILERMIAIQFQDTRESIVMYNPVILDTVDDIKVTTNEGCLSFPRVRLEIARYSTVVVKYQDRYGTEHTRQLDGIDSVCIQHEIDHLNGIVFKDYVSELKYERALRKAKK